MATPAWPLSLFTRKSGYHWYVVGTVCVGAFMAALDASIVNVALPAIGKGLNTGISLVEWVAIAYLLTLTTLVILFGRIADMLGRRPMYTYGFGVFIVGSALAGAAPSLGLLLAARVLQASGAALLQANSVAIITATVPASVRGKAIGIQGAAQAVGLSVGPVVGGLLMAAFSWRAIFYVNVPVGIIGTLLAAMILPRDRVHTKQTFDYVGALTIALGLFSVLFGVSQGYRIGWSDPIIVGSLVLGVAVLVFAAFWELRVDTPMVDPLLFKRRIFWSGNLSGLLSYALMNGTLFLMPFFLTRVMGLPPAQVGLLVVPVPLAMMVLSPVAGGWADRIGSQRLTVLGMAVSTLGVLALTSIGKSTSDLFLVAALAIVGVGMGLFTPPNNSSVMGSAPVARLGVAGGVLNMARSLGMSSGIAISATVLGSLLVAFGGSENTGRTAAQVMAFHGSFWALVILGLMAVAITLLREEREQKPS